ncbi:alpha amylase C-terminal domain-containing protein [Olleya sp. YSTF-M6]|uniref:Alpha amylase C-terminal domain-containing protein n=1 Tax=Olleya sediminilitoris TaxID=2795739 RepID=A0ABS1WM31_9FLAO|nr:alpha-amylase family glycosyl hydrolase [Olleya sediminilitoris]MBL7560179.1 alpha amylase C-terminal domain-containing protein [Olleya sediminilitoris]
MKKLILSLAILSVFACKEEKKQEETKVVTEEKVAIQPISASDLETAVIYEANIRQYSPEGTFEAFTKDIPQLKQLGVKVIWLMPVFPISETKRKATGGEDSKFATDFPEAEQDKYLGSYYAVSDFTKINPEFGTIENFRDLVNTAHDNGIYVILDWVPNHTGWDHTWLKTNPEYYTQNDKGEVVHPVDTDWTDVADLNYDNQEMRKAMIEDMSYWLTEEGVDGFRCDVAGSVPTNFWEQAIPELRAKKDIFMLAEAWKPELLKDGLFDMGYAWDRHHAMNAIAQGEKDATEFTATLQTDFDRYEADDILMNFVTNHDENSWNGTIKERMGEAGEMMTALAYVTPGMPLIYSGQEYDLDHRLLFFEKDSFPHTKGKTWKVLEKLATLKQNNAALHGGKASAKYKAIDNGENVISFSRTKGNDEVVFIANVSEENIKVSLPQKGTYVDYMSNQTVELNGDAIPLAEKTYKILVKQ